MEWMSVGEDRSALKGHVLCRRCNRVADSLATAIANGWEAIGIKIVQPNRPIGETEFYWGHCWSCLRKPDPGDADGDADL